MTSPRRNPESASGLDGLMSVTTTPLVEGEMPNCLAVSASRVSRLTPSRAPCDAPSSSLAFASEVGSSPSFTVKSVSLPSRRIFNFTSASGFIMEIFIRNSRLSATGLPLISRMMSPRCRPAPCCGQRHPYPPSRHAPTPHPPPPTPPPQRRHRLRPVPSPDHPTLDHPAESSSVSRAPARRPNPAPTTVEGG